MAKKANGVLPGADLVGVLKNNMGKGVTIYLNLPSYGSTTIYKHQGNVSYVGTNYVSLGSGAFTVIPLSSIGFVQTGAI